MQIAVSITLISRAGHSQGRYGTDPRGQGRARGRSRPPPFLSFLCCPRPLFCLWQAGLEIFFVQAELIVAGPSAIDSNPRPFTAPSFVGTGTLAKRPPLTERQASGPLELSTNIHTPCLPSTEPARRLLGRCRGPKLRILSVAFACCCPPHRSTAVCGCCRHRAGLVETHTDAFSPLRLLRLLRLLLLFLLLFLPLLLLVSGSLLPSTTSAVRSLPRGWAPLACRVQPWLASVVMKAPLSFQCAVRSG